MAESTSGVPVGAAVRFEALVDRARRLASQRQRRILGIAGLVAPTAVLADLVIRAVEGLSVGSSQEVPAQPAPDQHDDHPGAPPDE